ncbi:MAG: hypothetical protein FWC82_01320 [Firmicutes bacterium]|nr:hypothetical protein [Bacillota bacterium]
MKKFKRTISILLAAVLMVFTASVMTGCLGQNRPRGEYILYEVAVFDRAGVFLYDYHIDDVDFYVIWGDTSLFFYDDWVVDIFFDDWYHSDLNGIWDFELWNLGGGWWEIDIWFDWWTDDIAWSYDFEWNRRYDEVIFTYFGITRIYEFVFLPIHLWW